MKIRADFVTNSSSSSYMVVQIQNQVLTELLRSYKKKLGLSAVSKDQIDLVRYDEADCGSDTSYPTSYCEAVAEIWKILYSLSKKYPELREKLEESKTDIDTCFEYILYTNGYHEWGGDGDLRFDWDYPEGTTQEQIIDGAYQEGMYYFHADLQSGKAQEQFGLRNFDDRRTFYPRCITDPSFLFFNDSESFVKKDLSVQPVRVKTIVEKYKKPKAAVVVSDSANSAIAGLTFVITGDVHVFPNRNAVKAYIEANGGKLAGSVSSKTDYLINNDAASSSSKNVAAKKNNVPIITEDEFIEKFQVQIG